MPAGMAWPGWTASISTRQDPDAGGRSGVDPGLRQGGVAGSADRRRTQIQKSEYEEIAGRLDWIAHKQPWTFREALESIYTFHIAVLNEDQISGLSPGRVGQILWPWFEQDMAAGMDDGRRSD